MRKASALLAAVIIATVARVSVGSEVCWVPAHNLVPQDHSAAQLTSGDLDGDGDVDLSFPSYGPLRHYWNVGAPGVPAWDVDLAVYGGVSWCNGRRGALGDIDADGDLDLVTTCDFDYDGKLHLYRNVGSSAAPVWEEDTEAFDSMLSNRVGPLEPSLADVDADGDLDLLVANDFNHLLFVENTGTSQVSAWSDLGSVSDVEMPDYYPSADLGDLDGDGDLDLVAIGFYSPARSWENVGTPGAFEFIESPGMLTGVDAPAGGTGIELLDIDADGDVDLLISALFEQSNFLYLNERVTPVQPASWTSIKALFR